MKEAFPLGQTEEDQGALEAVQALMAKYRGPLTVEQISTGMKLCLKNARGLVFEAELLLKNQRRARAMSLALTAIEELGKVHVLHSMARIPKKNQKLWRDRWTQFRSHEAKASFAFPDTLPDEAFRFPDLILAASIDNSLRTPVGERLRQAGLYVEISEDNALSRIEIARQGLHRLEALRNQGWFSATVLKIAHEVLGPLNESMPKAAHVTSEHVSEQMGEFGPARREFYVTVIKGGFVHLPDSFEIAGVPWREFLEHPDT